MSSQNRIEFLLWHKQINNTEKSHEVLYIVIIKELFSIKGTTLFVWLTQKKLFVSIEKHQIVLCLQAIAALLRELLVSNIHGFCTPLS